MKKFFEVLLSVLLCLVILLGICAGGFFIFYAPSLTADLSVKTGCVTTGASGYLYGLAEEGIPSKNMTESIDISTVSQKVTGGLQHPIGDISHVEGQLDNTDYNVVYLQDAYYTWYYEQQAIEEMRSKGDYDWKAFVENDFLPKVEKSVKELSKTAYSDKVVYCLYNECDNGVWFGETKESEYSEFGVYGEYNEVGEQNFFDAWKMTYDFVKSINPDALIGGPGFCDYDHNEIEHFLEFCVNNDCVPEIMIYHELSDYSVYFWQNHVSDYREIELSLGIDELPIIVTEYGRMQDNGMPGKMLQYITQIEMTKVYGDNAYWRLADNLCDVAADDNSPNSNWWLYRWYADMEGQTVLTKYFDLFKSNVENALKGKAPYSSQGFMGIVSMTDDESKVDVICGGRDGSAVVKLKNINDTNLKDKTVHIKIEEVVYKGISGIVNAPVVLAEYDKELGSSLTIDLNDMEEANAYHITVTAEEGIGTEYENDSYIERYEFENGEILGSAYTYDSAYATTGEIEGMVGGMENEGDGVSVTINVPQDGSYDLNFIYGNSNDGAFDENGKQNPDDRTNSTVSLDVSIGGGNAQYDLVLPNTIKSEYTDCYTLPVELTAGEHTLTIKHKTGTIVLDSLLVTESNVDNNEIYFLPDGDRTNESTNSSLAIADAYGYYDISFDGQVEEISVNDNKITVNDNKACVYLMRGLNYIDVKNGNVFAVEKANDIGRVCYAYEGSCLDGAEIKKNAATGKQYLDNISCNGGRAEFDYVIEESGVYAITICYANNDEGGKHAYNVDLIERYVTIESGSQKQDIYCRNTYSWDTYKTVTAYVNLQKGENKIILSNSGNNKFDSQDTFAPHIASFTINEISK